MTGNTGELQVPSFVNSAREQMRNPAIGGQMVVYRKKEPIITAKEFRKLAFTIFVSVAAVLAIGAAIKATQKAGITAEARTGFTITEAQRNAYPEPGSEINSGRGQ